MARSVGPPLGLLSPRRFVELVSEMGLNLLDGVEDVIWRSSLNKKACGSGKLV
jgi:hypothetical protein